MRRRLDLAASLVGNPSVIYLDEPTTGLDPTKRDDVWAMIRRLTAAGTTVLLTTQYLDEADALADSIMVIDHGRVIANDTPQELKRVVGGQTLVVRPSDPARLDDVGTILTRVSGREVEEPARGQLSVPVEDDLAMTQVVRRLDDERIGVTELSLRLPGLDEVFYALTGESAESESAPADGSPEPEKEMVR